MEQFTDLLNKLAASLGTTAERLMEIYRQRAPLEWVDFWLCLAAFIALTVVSTVCFKGGAKAASKDTYDETEVGFFVAGSIAGVFAIIMMIVTGGEFSQAYKASMAPDAYAVDQILRAIESVSK